MSKRFSHTRVFNQVVVDRLQHIDEIFDRTVGWTKQLFNLYEERKALRIEVARMRRPDVK